MAILYETKTRLYENIQNKNKLYKKKYKAKKCDSFIQKSILQALLQKPGIKSKTDMIHVLIEISLSN